MENYRPTKEERRKLKEEIEYYRSLKGIETKSFERVSASGIFKDDERAQYAAIIDSILASADLQTVNTRQVRRGLAARLGIDLEGRKVCLCFCWGRDMLMWVRNWFRN